MTEQPTRRSLIERLVGRPRAWVACAYAALAIAWIVLAFIEPSGFHTFLAIIWTLLAAAQTAGYLLARRHRRTVATAAQDPSSDSATH